MHKRVLYFLCTFNDGHVYHTDTLQGDVRLEFLVSTHAFKDFQTARTGFSVLHPGDLVRWKATPNVACRPMAMGRGHFCWAMPLYTCLRDD